MSLKKKIMEDMKEAMKAKDMLKVSVLRLLNSEIKNKEIDKKGELSDDEILAVIQKAVKQRKEAIEQYEKADRSDLAEKEKKELEILESYLPKPLSEGELNALIDEVIKEVGATSVKDMGKVMQAIMPKVRGRADGKLVNQLVRKRLSG